MRKVFVFLTAGTLFAIGAGAAASNYINIAGNADGVGINSLSITQDATLNSNIISGNGISGGTALPISGAWSSVSLLQYGGGDVFSGSVKAASGSSSALLSISLGTAPAGSGGGGNGYNSERLTIGASNAPANPQVTISMANTASVPGAANQNSATDSFDVSGGYSLTYGLAITGNSNVISNTTSATGNTTLSESISGGNGNHLTNNLTTNGPFGTTNLYYQLIINGANGNTVNNLVSATYSISMGQTLTGSNNSITDNIGQTTVVGGYSETIQISGNNNSISNTVNNGNSGNVQAYISSNGSNITNVMDATNTSATYLTATGTTKVNYELTAGTTVAPIQGTTSSNVTLNNVLGAGGAAGTIAVTQSAASTSLNVTVNGNGYTMGASGVTLLQAHTGDSLNFTYNAAGNGYSVTMRQ